MSGSRVYIIPVKTYSKLNAREHWAVRSRRTKTERRAAGYIVPNTTPVAGTTVTLTRISPRPLDDDNLRGALKAIRDGVADRLGIDDRDSRVTWQYGQRRGEPRQHAVEVAIQMGAK